MSLNTIMDQLGSECAALVCWLLATYQFACNNLLQLYYLVALL